MSSHTNITFRHYLLHVARMLMLVVILFLMHWQHQQRTLARQAAGLTVNALQLQKIYPDASRLGEAGPVPASRNVLDAEDNLVGFVIQTSPDADDIIGFSGPTNLLIGFDEKHQILGVEVVHSDDTREHLAQILKDSRFLDSWDQLGWETASELSDVDAVSGATLTSYAIVQSLSRRLRGEQDQTTSIKFPNEPTLELIQDVFPDADHISQQGSWWEILQEETMMGSMLRTVPAADQVIGYQGPTETLIVFDLDEKVEGIRVNGSYDNEPYVTYVREETYFLEWFHGKTLEEIAAIELETCELEGVSGATMTSLAVLEGVVTATQNELTRRTQQKESRSVISLSQKVWGTLGMIVVGGLFAWGHWPGKKRMREPFLFLLVVYLGFINGDLLSQSMFVGWAKAGVPFQNAIGLVALTIAAFFSCTFTKTNLYCSHLCPHGAAQQLLKNRIRYKLHLSKRWQLLLSLIPFLLLVWVVIVGMLGLGFSLVDIEPFDAYVYQVAGWATISIAIGGLIFSLFVPMGYCRYGCPTGALLKYLRFHSRSDRWSRQDWAAMVCVSVAMILLYVKH